MGNAEKIKEKKLEEKTEYFAKKDEALGRRHYRSF